MNLGNNENVDILALQGVTDNSGRQVNVWNSCYRQCHPAAQESDDPAAGILFPEHGNTSL